VPEAKKFLAPGDRFDYAEGMEKDTPLPPPRAIVVCGPTGIGKTRTAIALARRFGGEIVGADSMQIYRYMDIGTAKPTPAEQAQVRHHMVDIIAPDAPYDAARYAEDAWRAVRHIQQRGRLPVVAGGTGLYVKALIYGLFDARPPAPEGRRRLETMADRHGSAYLHAELAACDPAAAKAIHINDRFRIIRALETFQTTGRPISALREAHRFATPRLTTFKLGLRMPRDALYARIDRRVDQMVAEGLLGEVESLLARGYAAGLKAMQSIGYRHMVAYLCGETDWEETLRLLKRDTRRYAKRQLTWFRADPEIVWTTPEAVAEVLPAIEAFLADDPSATDLASGSPDRR
jgi:tRNA dimethylallyltransferase